MDGVKEPRSDQDIIDAAIKFMRRSEQSDSENRANAIKWIKFRHGEQWPAEIVNSRTLEKRPFLTINKTDAYCQQVENQQRQQRPRIKVEPTNNAASKKTADVIQGMVRHIENTKGGGDLAYDTGFASAITTGRGYWRIRSDYVSEDSFDQELFLEPIDNPLSCYADDNSIMPDGSDQEEFLIADDMPTKEFERLYPGKDSGANWVAGAGNDQTWMTKDTVRVAEYFCIEKKPRTLVLLSDGTTIWKDEITQSKVDMWTASGVSYEDERESFSREVKVYKLTAMDVLEKGEIPGKWIPIVPTYGKIEVVDGKRKYSGIVKNAMDPAQMYNFWRTAMTESVALAPKAKWLMAEGQDEGHENEWNNANLSATAALRYKPTDVAGNPAAPPTRIQPEPPPSGAMESANAISNDLTSVLGIVDPAMRIGGNVSGKALRSEHSQADNSTFHFYDNMTRSIAHTGRILLGQIPAFYNEERIVRVVGDDSRSTLETINTIEEGKPKNDVTIGEYMVVMDTGPGYNTKRQEALDAMGPLFERNEKLMDAAGDLYFRNADFPGAETIADRLAAANPLAQIDEQSEIPPGAQMKLKAQEQQIQELTQQLQAAGLEIKQKAGIEQMKQEGATKRELIKATAATHSNDADNAQWGRDIDVKADTARHDAEVRAQAALSVAEINAVRDLLKTRVNNEHDMSTLDRSIQQEDKQLQTKSAETEA